MVSDYLLAGVYHQEIEKGIENKHRNRIYQLFKAVNSFV